MVTTLKDWQGEDYEYEVYECEEEIKQLFAPTEGFFFGGTEIDTWYKQYVDETITIIEDLLKEDEESKKHGLWSGEFYYQASW